jgi:hypothetical protein
MGLDELPVVQRGEGAQHRGTAKPSGLSESARRDNDSLALAAEQLQIGEYLALGACQLDF